MRDYLQIYNNSKRILLDIYYALLACPSGAEKKRVLDQRLADAHITPLWYPDGEHQHVRQILELLID